MKALRGRVVIALWLAMLAFAAAVVAHARYRADLSAFMPRSPSTLQRVLVQLLAEGPASRLILIGIDGSDARARADASRALATALAASGRFTAVENGASAATAQVRRFAFKHRYLLSDDVSPARFSVQGLRAAIRTSLATLASPAGLLLEPLFRSDPTGETLRVADEFAGTDQPPRCEGVWCSHDGRRALLIAQTRASGADTDAQARALQTIRTAFARLAPTRFSSAGAAPAAAAGSSTAAARAAAAPQLVLRVTGPGVFAAESRHIIESEAVRFSLVSTALIVMLLLAAYRSASALLFGLLPVASGALAGVASVALGFGAVHAITLGFGITLIGESVDYPIYLLVQSRGGLGGTAASPAALWPTLGLGAAASICGFASLLPSAFSGLAQLGLYSITGLAVAAAVTRWVLPSLAPRGLDLRDLAPVGEATLRWLARRRRPLALLAAVALAAVLALATHRHRLWTDDLAALSPVPTAQMQLDGRMRADLGAPDVSNLVLIEAPDPQTALGWAEQAGRRLDSLVAAQIIGGYDSPARFLPSRATQQARLASIPDGPTLRARLSKATVGLAIAPGALAPFVQQAEAARQGGLITTAALQGSALGLAVDGLLWQQQDGWLALLPLQPPGRGDIDIARVRAALATLAPGHVQVLNARAETDALYASYLSAALRLSALGLAAIVLLLAVSLRSWRRVARVMLPLLLAVVVVAAAFAASGTPMNLLHLIGMLLVIAVGSNYALFFDAAGAHPDRAALPRTVASLMLANASTVIGFGVLGFSSLPVLSSLGRTVAPGTFLALLFAAMLAPRALLRAPDESGGGGSARQVRGETLGREVRRRVPV